MDEVVKQAIRHRYESTTSFDELVKVARAMEQEAIEFKDFRCPVKHAPARSTTQRMPR